MVVMDQLNHLIDTTFSDVAKFELSNRRYTLQCAEFDRM